LAVRGRIGGDRNVGLDSVAELSIGECCGGQFGVAVAVEFEVGGQFNIDGRGGAQPESTRTSWAGSDSQVRFADEICSAGGFGIGCDREGGVGTGSCGSRGGSRRSTGPKRGGSGGHSRGPDPDR